MLRHVLAVTVGHLQGFLSIMCSLFHI